MTTAADIRDEAGFTLLELLFAVIILATGLLGAAAMQMTAIQGNAYGMKLSEANDRLISRMEDIKGNFNSEKDGLDAEGFTRKTTVQEDTPQSGVKTVEVEVSWNDEQGGERHKVSFRTIIME